MSKRIFHRYLGLSLSVILLIMSITGVMLLWKKEYLWLNIGDSRELITPELLPNAIANIESQYKLNEVVFIQFYSEDLAIHKVFLSEQRYAWHNQRGDFIQLWQGNERFEDFVLDLHHRFLLGNTVGLNIAGIGGIFASLTSTLGLLIWWRRRKRLSKGFLPQNYKRGGLLISHGNLGAVFFIPITLLIVTGVILVYPVESRSVLLDSFGLNEPAHIEYDASSSKLNSNKSLDHTEKPRLSSWSAMINYAQERFPESRIRSAQPAKISPTKEQAFQVNNSEPSNVKRSINLQQVDGWHRLGRTSIKFYDDGRIEVQDELKQAVAKRVLGFTYPLHTAKLGFAYKLFLTLVGLAFSIICVFGVYAYFLSVRINRRSPS